MQLPAFVTDYSLPALHYQQELVAWCQQMRADQALFYNEESDLWIVLRYKEALLLDNYTLFSSAQRLSSGGDGRQSNSIISMDPPRHRQLRSLLTHAFSARAIAAMAPQIEAIGQKLLDRVSTHNEFDWMAAMANPLPVMVIANILGLPEEDWQLYKTWTDAMVNETPLAAEAGEQLFQRFMHAIEEHKRQPRPDLLSSLLSAEVDGQRLSYEDLMGFCFTLFIAGNITTTNLLGNALLCFYTHPESLASLRQNPSQLPTAIEEVLRFMPPFRSGPNNLVGGRTVMQDTTIANQSIPAGARIAINRVSVNYDAQQFSQPERFDITRTPNPHQTFGHGIHFCIGAPLARLETKIALNLLLTQLPTARLVEPDALEQIASPLFFGLKHLPLAR